MFGWYLLSYFHKSIFCISNPGNNDDNDILSFDCAIDRVDISVKVVHSR